MHTWFESCYERFSDSLKVFVLTGGEPFLLGSDLETIIQHAAGRGLIVRIVSNAFWATSYDTAFNILKDLQKVGLQEINYSTGDEHQEWVPFTNIQNAAIAAVQLKLTCVINIETHDESKFQLYKEIGHNSLLYKYICEKSIIIENGAWTAFNGKEKTYSNHVISPLPQPCNSILKTLSINPYGEVLACCGLYAERNPFLRIGNIQNFDIGFIYSSAASDLIKLWLYTDGPNSILDYLNKKKGSTRDINKSCHICTSCAKIFQAPQNIELLRNNKSEYASAIYLKFLLLNHKK